MTAARNRGRSNGNEAGSAKNRRDRRQWLLVKFGDGERALCQVCHETWVDIKTMFVGRIIPGHKGGTYRRDNVRPECRLCSCREGHKLMMEIKAMRAALAADLDLGGEEAVS